MSEVKVGRLPTEERGVPVLRDDPTKVSEAILTKLDEISSLMKNLAEKLDADTGVTDGDYAAVLTDALDEIELKL